MVEAMIEAGKVDRGKERRQGEKRELERRQDIVIEKLFDGDLRKNPRRVEGEER
ncbi:MAG: hypothetical protein QF858_01350 [Candidatus Pacebacteria bacterium]|nr:hypothetical protein [Candidatus Paceibacterota bacterium]